MVYNPGLIQSSVFSLWLDFFITAPFQSFENCFVAKQFETIIEELTLERAWSWFKINNLKILFSIWCLQSSKLHVLLLFQMVSHNIRVHRQIMCRALNSLLNTGNLRAWGLNKMTLQINIGGMMEHPLSVVDSCVPVIHAVRLFTQQWLVMISLRLRKRIIKTEMFYSHI